MSDLWGAVAFFCLATGAAMGCAFLGLRTVCQLLGVGKLGTFVVDVLFGFLCGGFVFLCALAVDHGSLRLYQGVLQGLGAWATVTALGPGCRWVVRAVKKFFCRLSAFWDGAWRKMRGHFPAPKAQKGKARKKTGKKQKKQ